MIFIITFGSKKTAFTIHSKHSRTTYPIKIFFYNNVLDICYPSDYIYSRIKVRNSNKCAEDILRERSYI